MPKFVDEFKTFIMRGNVLDMAVGIIIGGAFGKIINSLVADILMPPIGRILGKVDFSSLFINISGTHYDTLEMAIAAGAATINYGLFINNIINFLIVGFAIFILIRYVNKLSTTYTKPAPVGLPTTKECVHCLSTIPIKAMRCAHCTASF